MKQEILEIIKPIIKETSGSQPLNIYGEIGLFKQILENHEWKLLDDQSKIEKRKIRFRLWSKWNFEERQQNGNDGGPKYIYLGKCINVYDIIQQKLGVLAAYENDVELTSLLVRLKALLLIEAEFINESLIPVKHVPIFLFKEIQKELSLAHEISIADMLVEYEILYKNWKEKPNTDIYNL